LSDNQSHTNQTDSNDCVSYTQETIQTDDELMADNVQTFINMCAIQRQFGP